MTKLRLPKELVKPRKVRSEVLANAEISAYIRMVKEGKRNDKQSNR